MQMMKRLIYLSSAKPSFDMSDIEGVLNVSRRNNAEAGVTGLLLFHDGCFFQTLEGAPDEVTRIFNVIRNDARHAGVLVLEDRLAKDRAFADWSMGFVGADALRSDQRDCLVDLTRLVGRETVEPFSPSPSIARQVESFLSSFREFAPS
jgi:hypothetical protein